MPKRFPMRHPPHWLIDRIFHIDQPLAKRLIAMPLDLLDARPPDPDTGERTWPRLLTAEQRKKMVEAACVTVQRLRSTSNADHQRRYYAAFHTLRARLHAAIPGRTWTQGEYISTDNIFMTTFNAVLEAVPSMANDLNVRTQSVLERIEFFFVEHP